MNRQSYRFQLEGNPDGGIKHVGWMLSFDEASTLVPNDNQPKTLVPSAGFCLLPQPFAIYLKYQTSHITTQVEARGIDNCLTH